MRDYQFPGRSVSYGTRGAAATSHPLASLAAIDMLRAGGNAIDAAIAACALLCVAEPMSSGVGGDCFALCWIAKENRIVAINGSGHAPAALSAEWLIEHGHPTITQTSVHSVTIPGAIDAWHRLNADHGRLPMAAILEPAIDCAENGFAVTSVTAGEWKAGAPKLAADKNAANHYLKDQRAPAAGEIMKVPGLAGALRRIARGGRDAFYAGELAQEMVSYLNSIGGVHTLADFSEQHSQYVEPILTRYRDAEIVQMPPNSQGLVTLLMMNILSGFDLKGQDPYGAERFHLLTEATRLAFEVRDSMVADPAFADVPVAHILSDAFASELRARIRLDRAMSYGPKESDNVERDTIFLSVVDAERNVCSLINSLYFHFGSGLVSPQSGVLFHNRGFGFRVQPGHPNNVAPRKRPSHTILPGLALKKGRPWLSLGVKGAFYQPIGQAQILMSVIDDGMDIQEAIDGPRCGFNDRVVELERGISAATRSALVALGHPIAEAKAPLGGAQAVLIDEARGTLAAGSDPRKDGMALCY
jgi:gamma-glutamyltranspeptidase / glutathione hydrolase